MDPRLHRRRIQVRRDEGRHRLRVLVAISGVVVAGYAGWWATRSPLLDVDRVAVTGAAHVSVREVRTASGVRRGQPLTTVDPAAARRGIAALPWVEHATVHREWPGQVSIRVTERVPVAATASAEGGFALVDATGRVLSHVANLPADLVGLTGLPPAGGPGTHLGPDGAATLSVAAALPASLVARTADVEPRAGATGEVELRLTPEGTVRIGPLDNLPQKFQAIAAVLAQVDVRNLAVLDVRRPDSPVLTRRDTSTKVSTPRTG